MDTFCKVNKYIKCKKEYKDDFLEEIKKDISLKEFEEIFIVGNQYFVEEIYIDDDIKKQIIIYDQNGKRCVFNFRQDSCGYVGHYFEIENLLKLIQK